MHACIRIGRGGIFSITAIVTDAVGSACAVGSDVPAAGAIGPQLALMLVP